MKIVADFDLYEFKDLNRDNDNINPLRSRG